MSPPIVIAVALAQESGGLRDIMGQVETIRCAHFTEHRGRLDGRPVVVAETGVGRSAAGIAADDLIGLYRPRWFIAAGFAGGLIDRLRRNDIVLATSVGDVQGHRLQLGGGFVGADDSGQRGPQSGHLVTVDHLVADPNEKRQLAAEHGAIACDMESFAMADICCQQGVHCLAVRVVSDTVDELLPPEIGGILKQTSWAAKLGAAAGALVRRPSSAKDFWKLRENSLVAADHLARFLSTIVRQLPNE